MTAVSITLELTAKDIDLIKLTNEYNVNSLINEDSQIIIFIKWKVKKKNNILHSFLMNSTDPMKVVYPSFLMNFNFSTKIYYFAKFPFTNEIRMTLCANLPDNWPGPICN